MFYLGCLAASTFAVSWDPKFLVKRVVSENWRMTNPSAFDYRQFLLLVRSVQTEEWQTQVHLITDNCCCWSTLLIKNFGFRLAAFWGEGWASAGYWQLLGVSHGSSGFRGGEATTRMHKIQYKSPDTCCQKMKHTLSTTWSNMQMHTSHNHKFERHFKASNSKWTMGATW